MAITRTRLSRKTTEIFRSLERTTKYTPNLLARLALALSLEDKKALPEELPDNAGQELNHATLYGPNESIYKRLAIEWAGDAKVDVCRNLRQHIERGAGSLQKSLATGEFFDL